jgi:hypothetical protein
MCMRYCVYISGTIKAIDRKLGYHAGNSYAYLGRIYNMGKDHLNPVQLPIYQSITEVFQRACTFSKPMMLMIGSRPDSECLIMI